MYLSICVLYAGEYKAECDHCNDNPNRRCKHCSCCVCGGKREPDKQLMCDECDTAYHIYCLQPPLSEIPDVEEWFVLFISVISVWTEHSTEQYIGRLIRSFFSANNLLMANCSLCSVQIVGRGFGGLTPSLEVLTSLWRSVNRPTEVNCNPL